MDEKYLHEDTEADLSSIPILSDDWDWAVAEARLRAKEAAEPLAVVTVLADEVNQNQN